MHRKHELEQIAELANRHGVAVISDEIHAALTYQEIDFTPYLSIPTAAEWGFTITSASKAWNIAGLKAGMVIPGSLSAARRISKMPAAVHWLTSIIGAFAMVSAFKAGDAWLKQTLSQLDFNRKYLNDLLNQELPNVGYRIPESSYLAWLDLTAYGSNPSWHDQILT